jgi:hypothetical protein
MFNVPSFFGFKAGGEQPPDPDALAFFGRVDAATGVSDYLTLTEKSAIDTLVKKMKTDGVWTNLKAAYPMVGGGNGTLAQNQAACEQNLVSASFTGTFSSGWTFASTGVTPNGSSAYMDSGLIPLNDLSLSSGHLSFYSRTNEGVASNCEMGAFDSSAGFPIVMLAIKSSAGGGDRYELRHFCLNGTFGPASPSDTRGFGCNTKTLSGQVKAFWNNSLIGSATVTDALTNQPAFASIGDGLTDTEASDFYTAVQAFQTTLSRNV